MYFAEIVFVLQFCLLFVPSTCFSLVTSILQSFENKSPIHCSIVIWAAKTELKLDFSDLSFPIYHMNSDNLIAMKSASQACKNHIFILDDLEDLKLVMDWLTSFMVFYFH